MMHSIKSLCLIFYCVAYSAHTHHFVRNHIDVLDIRNGILENASARTLPTIYALNHVAIF
jgi:hypothetical protein